MHINLQDVRCTVRVGLCKELSVSLTLPVACPLQAPTADSFHSRVPVRIRVEPRNSLNNRFAPDSRIRTQAVLSLDDDIFMPCSDIGTLRCQASSSTGCAVNFYVKCWGHESSAWGCCLQSMHSFSGGGIRMPWWVSIRGLRRAARCSTHPSTMY